MKISVFLSYPKPHIKKQEEFINRLELYLKQRGFLPRTLGVTDYNMDAPLSAIRSLMLESNGLITIALRRTFVSNAVMRKYTDIDGITEIEVSNRWLTSPYCQIEPAMAFQLGLPILIIREKGVVDDGLLEKGVMGVYMPEVDLEDSLDNYFNSVEWYDIIGKWEGYVRSVVSAKGNPPKLW
ncbi:MAG: hypothetical protein L3V56_11770 [Candidatus Magnetoovum sp. WYHC-5]|nr:hypothetical protein [Candidatus Magnetoovum sp. WYHC-5]